MPKPFHADAGRLLDTRVINNFPTNNRQTQCRILTKNSEAAPHKAPARRRRATCRGRTTVSLIPLRSTCARGQNATARKPVNGHSDYGLHPSERWMLVRQSRSGRPLCQVRHRTSKWSTAPGQSLRLAAAHPVLPRWEGRERRRHRRPEGSIPDTFR